jgi:hypothetical protein
MLGKATPLKDPLWEETQYRNELYSKHNQQGLPKDRMLPVTFADSFHERQKEIAMNLGNEGQVFNYTALNSEIENHLVESRNPYSL